MQYIAVIMQSIFSQMLTIDTPKSAREGEVCKDFCESKVWFIMLYWTTL